MAENQIIYYSCTRIFLNSHLVILASSRADYLRMHEYMYDIHVHVHECSTIHHTNKFTFLYILTMLIFLKDGSSVC